MKLFNSLTKKNEVFKPLRPKQVRMYSCGPTVYGRIHIGNLAAFIYADTLRRVLQSNGYTTKHVMNITDVDDKTIKTGVAEHPGVDPKEALTKSTRAYEQLFMDDITAVGLQTKDMTFVRATDSIDDMQALITELVEQKKAYVEPDGVYLSLEAYRKSGRKYGQLVELSDEGDHSQQRINNDEYDKHSAHDFALWKRAKAGEPSWEFKLSGVDVSGRPGWHIECSAMATKQLGQPFDIHTGGIDLAFPHHENEIAQSTATGPTSYANWFVHNEHVLIDNAKMSKSLGNVYNLEDLAEHHVSPLAFRLLCLQSHYRSRLQFSWETLAAAQQRLLGLQNMATWRFQANDKNPTVDLDSYQTKIHTALNEDLGLPTALAALSKLQGQLDGHGLASDQVKDFSNFINRLDDWLGLGLTEVQDINTAQRQLLADREAARVAQNYKESDRLRDELAQVGLEVRDHQHGSVWARTQVV